MAKGKYVDRRAMNGGRRGIPPERCGLSDETKLDTLIRRHKNDSLIAWHLDIPIEEVREARANWKEPTTQMRGGHLTDKSPFDIREFTKRQEAAAESNDAYIQALTRRGARG